MADQKKLIFLAEDDPLMVRMYERLLKLSGFDSALASDGDEAIVKLKAMQTKPNLILLDIMMPKLSGFEVLKFIKQDPVLKDIPVVVLSNLAGKEDADRALAMGAMFYLVKSKYTPNEIVEKLKAILAAQ